MIGFNENFVIFQNFWNILESFAKIWRKFGKFNRSAFVWGSGAEPPKLANLWTRTQNTNGNMQFLEHFYKLRDNLWFSEANLKYDWGNLIVAGKSLVNLRKIRKSCSKAVLPWAIYQRGFENIKILYSYDGIFSEFSKPKSTPFSTTTFWVRGWDVPTLPLEIKLEIALPVPMEQREERKERKVVFSDFFKF